MTLDPAVGAEVPKTRPCVVVSRTVANENLSTVTVVPLSSIKRRQKDRLVQPIIFSRESCLPKDSRALCDQVRTIDKARIHRMAGILPETAMHRISQGLILHLGLEEE